MREEEAPPPASAPAPAPAPTSSKVQDMIKAMEDAKKRKAFENGGCAN